MCFGSARDRGEMPTDVDNVMLQLASAGFRISERKSKSSSEPSKEHSQTRTLCLLPKDHWISDSESQECQRCQKEFDLFTRKHHCRLCGALLCKGCCPNWKCPPSFQPAPLRACFCCFFKLRPHHVPRLLALSVSTRERSESVFAHVCLMLDPWSVMRMLSVCRQWALQARGDEIWRRLFKRYSMEKLLIGRSSRLHDRWLVLFAKHVGPNISERSTLKEATHSNMELPWFQATDVDPWTEPRRSKPVRSKGRPFVCPRPGVQAEWEAEEAPSRSARARGMLRGPDSLKFRQPWEFSLVCLGPSGSGKSCLLYRLKTGGFRELERTQGACFVTHTMTVKFRKPSQPKQQQLARVSFWDLGSSPFASFASMYTRTAHGVLFFLDLSRTCAQRDFVTLQQLHKKFVVRTQTASEHPIDHLILTKADLRLSWDEKVAAAAREWASGENMHVVEASAKHGANVVGLFERVVAPLIASAISSFSAPVNEQDNLPLPFHKQNSLRRDSVHYSRTEETGDIRRRNSEQISRTETDQTLDSS